MRSVLRPPPRSRNGRYRPDRRATFLVSGRRTYADAVPCDVSLVGTDIQGEVILTAKLTATQISGPTGR